MSPSDAEYTANLIARRLGLPVKAILASADRLQLMPSETHAHDGFSVEVRTGWRTLETQFLPGKFARPLLEKMGEASVEGRLAFSALAALASKQGKLTFRINGEEQDAQDPTTWPPRWLKLELVLKKQGIVFEELAPGQLKEHLGNIVAPIFGMCIALIGADDVDSDASALEGDSTEKISRTFERKPVNREICLSTRGRRCYCCNFDFGEVYGAAAEGFIEVHHTTPVSEFGPGYKINPVTDLVPVCSNCHSVVHLTKPARTVDEVRSLLRSNARANEPST